MSVALTGLVDTDDSPKGVGFETHEVAVSYSSKR